MSKSILKLIYVSCVVMFISAILLLATSAYNNIGYQSVVAVFTGSTSNLYIDKMAVNDNTDPLDATQEALQFNFKVTFSDNATETYEYYVTDTAITHTVTNSSLYASPAGIISSQSSILSLSSSQTAVFFNLPIGVNYRIEEIITPNWFISSEGSQGNITAGSISGGVTAAGVDRVGVSASYLNTYYDVIPSGSGVLKVLKTVPNEVSDYDMDKVFNINIEFLDHSGTSFSSLTYKLNGTGPALFPDNNKIPLKASDFAIFENVPIGTTYNIYEDNYSSDGYYSSITNGNASIQTDTAIAIEAEITNTFVGIVETTISGKKTWDTSAKPGVSLPTSITVQLKNGSTIVDSKDITAGAIGDWAYEFHAPKYATDGITPISYSVGEFTVPNFKPTVNGNNILNTYVPDYVPPTPPPVDPDEPDTDYKPPQTEQKEPAGVATKPNRTRTGDSFNIVWLIFFISLVSILAILLAVRMKKLS